MDFAAAYELRTGSVPRLCCIGGRPNMAPAYYDFTTNGCHRIDNFAFTRQIIQLPPVKVCAMACHLHAATACTQLSQTASSKQQAEPYLWLRLAQTPPQHLSQRLRPDGHHR